MSWNPCRDCPGDDGGCMEHPAECGVAKRPPTDQEIQISTDNLLERAFMTQIKAEEYAADLRVLQQEFDKRPDVIDLKRKIDQCEHEWKTYIDQAREAGISKQGSFILKVRTRKSRNVIPERFFAKYGAETFVACSTVAIGQAEALLGKGVFDDCCETTVKETDITVEYVRPEGRA